MRSILCVLPLLAGSLFPAAQTKPKPAAAAAIEVEPREWEHEDSDLPVDPKFNFGALKNGMRYVWVKSHNPPKQIFLRLHVDIGSLVEDDTEQGMAHFVEHMAFNGTTKFKAGTLVETFNKQGIKFGSDVNAHTGMDETVYELDLPDTEPARLKIAFQWMRDVASGLKMDDKEVQAEKGVIDSEQRDRDSPGFRLFVERMTKLGDGLRLTQRLPIGIKDVRAKFTGKSCLAFYKRWYRPENMTFMIVGDFGSLDPTVLIEEHLGSIPVPKGEAAERPDLGTPSFKHKFFSIESGGDGGTINIAKLRPFKLRRDDSANLVAGIPIQIAMILVGQRLNERQEKEKLPFRGAGAQLFNFEQQVQGPLVQISCEAAKWRDALTAAERELRRLLDQGCTDDEVKKAWTAFQQRLVPRSVTPPPHSIDFVNELMTACNGRYVPMEDRARKEAMRPGTKGLSAASLMKVLREEWAQGEFVIYTEGGIDLGADPQAEIMEVWNAAKATDLATPMVVAAAEPPKEGETGKEDEPKKEGETKPVDPSTFAYAKPDVVRDATATVQRFDDLKSASIALKNGVKALYRKSDGDARGFGRWEVRVGEGESALEPGQHAIAYAAARWFLRGGLGKNDWATVQAAGGAVGFDIEADALVFSGNVIYGADPKRDFESICAYLTDPGFRQEAWDEWKAKLDEEFKEGEGKEHLGQLLGKFHDDVRAPEPRLSRPTKEAVAAVTIEQARAFLQAQLDGPIAITAAGVDAGKFEKSLFSTFATLPTRRAGRPNESRRAIAPLKSGLNVRAAIDTGDKSALIHVLYPCPDAIDAATARKLELLEDIVNDRLRIEIREKRGGAYSPRAAVWGSEEWRGLGWVTLDVQVDPAKVDDMAKACVAAMESMSSKGITQPELDRMRTARLGSVEETLKDYGTWFSALRAAHQKPAVIDEMRAYKATFEKITLAEMNALAKPIFGKGKENVFVATPKS